MLSKSIFKKTMLTLAAGACAGFFTAALPAYAQLPGASPQANDSTPINRRLVLHDVRVQGRHLSVALSSRPVLDYAIQILQQYPETLVYVSGQGNASTVQREAQAVARYLAQRGISANRLVLSNPTPAEHTASADKSTHASDVIVLNLTEPGAATHS